MRHVLSANQWSRADIERLFDVADETQVYLKGGGDRPLADRLVAMLWYEPSTRTRFSFEIAAQRLGARVVSTESADKFSSAAKGETLEDSVRILEGYGVDAVVLRHYEEGAARRAAGVLQNALLINAGDGPGEHPTQALLDCYALRRELGRCDGIRVVFLGDLRHGRTVHSLARLLLRFRDVEMVFVAPDEVRLPEDLRRELTERQARFREAADLRGVLGSADAVYVTRLQRERFADPDAYARLQGRYALTPVEIAEMPAHAAILHPLPRTEELPPSCDVDPRAAYFRQAAGGLLIRMALLITLLGAGAA